MPRFWPRIVAFWLTAFCVACGAPVNTPTAPSDSGTNVDADPNADIADLQSGFDSDSAMPDVAAVDSANADVLSSDGAVGDAIAPQSDTSAPPTTIWIHYPKAAEIALRGDTPPLSWTQDLPPTEVAGDVAKFTLPTAGQILVKATRKGAWAVGNNLVVLDHEQRHLYPYFDPASAAATRENYNLNGPEPGPNRTLRAWLPPGYKENTLAHYPLLLMLDGQNVFDDQTASFGVSWKLGDAILQAMAAAKLGEIVVIGVDHAGPKRIFEYTPWPDGSMKDGGGGEAF